ncbi:MAG: hypothetical protein ACLRQF_07085 [Thomasclavelia ramosa]
MEFIMMDFDYPSRALKLWLANGGDTTMRNIREYLQKINLDMKIIVLSGQLF